MTIYNKSKLFYYNIRIIYYFCYKSIVALHSSDDCESSDELEKGKSEIYLLLTFNSYAV